MSRSRLRPKCFCLALCIVFLGLPVAAHAAIDKCQLEIEKRTALFQSKVASALKKCADAIRREQVKNLTKPGTGFLVLAAHRCQKDLNRIFDLPQVLGGKSERDKFFVALQNAFTGTPTPKCTASDLRQLGFLPGGSLAPGVHDWDFAKVWLVATAFERALRGQLAMQGDFLTALGEALSAPSKPPGTSVSTAATNCTLSPSCNPLTDLGCRPDLCRLSSHCHQAACAIDTSASDVGLRVDRPGSAPAASVPAAAGLGFCTLQGLGYPFGNLGEGVLLAGEASRSLPPVTVGGKTLCAELVRVAGFCACSSPFTNLPRDVSLCQDRLASNGDACPGSPVSGTGGGDTDFPGTTIAALREAWSDATGAGDCVALAILRITVVTSGGEGADGQPCTGDDSAGLASSQALLVPLTTGTASASLQDAISTPGGCSGSGSCIEDANCPSGQTCSSPAPSLATLAGPTLSGAPLSGSCANFNSGQLGGLHLVATTPLPGVGQDLGDVVISLKLACQ